MSNKNPRPVLAVLMCLLVIVLAALLGTAIYLRHGQQPEIQLQTTTGTTPAQTTVATTVATVPPTTVAVTEATTVPTTAATTVPTTVPEPIVYTLTFAGDCTLGNQKEKTGSSTFIGTVGDDYAHPFSGVQDYFSTDDCTFVNLEGALTDRGTPADKKYVFKGPSRYVNILTQGKVEFANVVNNHARDYGTTGYQDTLELLDQEGIAYAENKKISLFTTESGLTIGVYAELYPEKATNLTEKIGELRSLGAEIVIASFHWGTEYHYRPSSEQTKIAHAAIDAGADIVYGHHPHVLQKIEAYNGGMIFYSLGNFSFGGNANPPDKDTAIIQQQIIRDSDGTIRLGETVQIPCYVTGISSYGNDYRPVPIEEGAKAYNRVLSKLAGTHSEDVLYVSYREDLH